jgi:undecaprenyl-diphosphatase
MKISKVVDLIQIVGERANLLGNSVGRGGELVESRHPTIVSGEAPNFDQWLLLLPRDPANPADPLGPDWVQYFMVSITALGSTPILLMVTALAAGFLIVQRHSKSAALLTVTFIGGVLLSNGLKQLFLRERPDLVAHLVEVSSPSLPSGHAMKSALVYLTIAAIFTRSQDDWAARRYLWAAAVSVTLLVGLSRVYLGVHWPTDVIAGWFAGALWAAICVLIVGRIDQSPVDER